MALNTDVPFYPTGGGKWTHYQKKVIKLSGNPTFVGFFLSRVFLEGFATLHIINNNFLIP